MMLVTLDQAKDHLRVDYDFEDDLITMYVQGASAAVLNYLKTDGQDYFDSSGDLILDSSGETIVPFAIEAATLMMCAYLYRLRGDNEDNTYERGYLPMPVTAILYPLRDPALA